MDRAGRGGDDGLARLLAEQRVEAKGRAGGGGDVRGGGLLAPVGDEARRQRLERGLGLRGIPGEAGRAVEEGERGRRGGAPAGARERARRAAQRDGGGEVAAAVAVAIAAGGGDGERLAVGGRALAKREAELGRRAGRQAKDRDPAGGVLAGVGVAARVEVEDDHARADAGERRGRVAAGDGEIAGQGRQGAAGRRALAGGEPDLAPEAVRRPGPGDEVGLLVAVRVEHQPLGEGVPRRRLGRAPFPRPALAIAGRRRPGSRRERRAAVGRGSDGGRAGGGARGGGGRVGQGVGGVRLGSVAAVTAAKDDGGEESAGEGGRDRKVVSARHSVVPYNHRARGASSRAPPPCSKRSPCAWSRGSTITSTVASSSSRRRTTASVATAATPGAGTARTVSPAAWPRTSSSPGSPLKRQG